MQADFTRLQALANRALLLLLFLRDYRLDFRDPFPVWFPSPLGYVPVGELADVMHFGRLFYGDDELL